MSEATKQFKDLNYGTKVSTSKLDTIEVRINPDLMVKDYAKATVLEMYRMNPIKFEGLSITEEDVYYYFSQLLSLRIQQVNGQKVPWRLMKSFCAPAWIEFSLTNIGEVILADLGLRFIPVESESPAAYSEERMLSISSALRSFEREGLAIVVNVFATSVNGDPEVMTLCILDGYVHGMNVNSHPVKSYVASFLGQTLVKEQSFKVLYRVRYDDIHYVASTLLNDPKVFRHV